MSLLRVATSFVIFSRPYLEQQLFSTHNCHLSPVDLKVDLLGKVIVQLVVGLQPGLQGLPSRVSDVGHLAGLTGVLLQISTEEQYYECGGSHCGHDDSFVLLF